MTTSAATDVLLDRARAWLTDDPDPATRAELERVLADVEAGADTADLVDRFAGPRVRHRRAARGVGAGPKRMNRVVVSGGHRRARRLPARAAARPRPS